MKNLCVFLSLLLLPLATAQFTTGVETRGFEREVKGSGVFDAAMTSEMNAGVGNTFQIDCVKGLDKVRDAKLRKHLSTFLDKPLTFKLTNNQATKRGGNTYRAIVKTQSGDALRGYWKRGKSTETLRAKEMMDLSYDECVRRKNTQGSVVDFEVQLPPLKGYLPSIVYNVVLGKGTASMDSSICRSSGMVKIHPKGIESKGFKLGTTHICNPMRAGIVDHAWCKGKTIFRRGRSVGQV